MRLRGWFWLLVLLLTGQVAAQETGRVDLERNLAIVEGPVDNPRDWIVAAFSVGNFYRNNPQQAERYFLKAVAVAQQYKLLDLEASVYNQLSVIFRNEQKGLKYLLKTIVCVEKLGDKNRLMNLQLMQAGFYFRLQQPQKAIDLYEELLPEFRKTASRHDLVLALFNYGNAVIALGDFEKALELGEVVSTISAKIPDTKMEMQGLMLQGKALQKLGHQEASLRVRNELLRKAEAAFDIEMQTTALLDIAGLLEDINDWKRALPYLKSAADLSKNMGPPEKQFYLQLRLARLYLQIGDLTNAAPLIDNLQALQLTRNLKGKASVQLLKGRLLYESGAYGQGIDLMQRGLLQKGQPNYYVATDQLIVAEYFSSKGFYKKAEEHFDLIKSDLRYFPAAFGEKYKLAWLNHQRRKKGQPQLVKAEVAVAAVAPIRKKSKTKPSDEKTRVLQLEDSLRQLTQAEQIALLDADNKRIAAEIRKNEFRFYLFLLSLLLLLVVSGFGLFWYRNRKEQAELLAEKERQIRELELEEVEKRKKLEVIDALLTGQEIERKRIAESLHDDVGSMLSALRLQLERFETEEQPASEKAHLSLRNAKSMLDHVTTDVRNLSHMLMPTSLDKFGLKKAVELYVEQLNHAGKIHFELLITGLAQQLSEKIELSAYRIILELCNNILKHAEARNVIIQLVEHEDQLVIMVEDNGKGFEPVDNSADGIGLRTIESRIHLMNGRMSVESSPGHGTLISIELPLAVVQ